MKTTTFIPIGLALAVSALNLMAQGGPGRYGRGGPPGAGARGGGAQIAPPVAVILDADKDGVLSAKEIAAAPEALRKLDRNNDGKLSTEELCPGGWGGGGWGRGAAAGRRTLMFALFDTDNDGTVSQAEWRNASASLLKLDRNNDGQLTADELRPVRGGGGPPWRR